MAIIISVILLFVGIGVLVLIHICIVGRAFRRGFGTGDMVVRARNRSNSMSHDDLEKLPCFDFKAEEKGGSPDCAVCLENFKVGDKCRLLPICKHSFHAHCIDLWLLKTPICPICRTSADSRTGSMASGEESSRSIEVGMELREIQPVVVESSHSIEVGMDLRETQLAMSGTELSSNPIIMQAASANELAV